ncbi:hypothetical protein MMC17_000769 [Xylographa soralifera]|nr:hypothetical protein [Xylographa soralifera]
MRNRPHNVGIATVPAAPSTTTEELEDAVAEPCAAPADDDAEVPGVVEEPEGKVLANAEAFEAGSAGESGSSVDVPTEAELRDKGKSVDDFGPAEIVVEADDIEEVAPLDEDPDDAALLVPNPRVS